MIAKIVEENREYYSFVFAKFNPGFYETIIVFDDEYDKFKLLNVYDTKPSLKRKLFIIDTDTEGMITKDKIKISLLNSYTDCFGYDWIINNNELINTIKKGGKVEDKYIQLAKETNKLIEISEWKFVKNEKDAKDLLVAAWDFHDAELRSINYKLNEVYDDPSVIQVLFTGCWECDILLEFKRDVLIHFNIDDKNSYEIMDANILFDDGYVYWVDEFIENVNEISDDFIYFRGRSLKWKMINKK